MADTTINSGLKLGIFQGLAARFRERFAAHETSREDEPGTEDRRDFFLEMLDCSAFENETDFQMAMMVYPGRF
jgi:hypothetical protein